MKKSILALSLVLGLGYLKLPSEAKLKSEYDRFKKQTVIQTEPYRMPMSRPCMALFATYPGETPGEKPKSVVLMFNVKNKEWKYLRCNETNLLIDDEPFSLGEVRHQGDVSRDGSGVFETLMFIIAFDDIIKMASAHKIEGKICNTEFVFTDEERQDLRDLVKIFVPES